MFRLVIVCRRVSTCHHIFPRFVSVNKILQLNSALRSSVKYDFNWVYTNSKSNDNGERDSPGSSKRKRGNSSDNSESSR